MKKKPTKKKTTKAKAPRQPPKQHTPAELVEIALTAMIEVGRKNPAMPAHVVARNTMAQYPSIYHAIEAQILLTRLNFGLGGFIQESSAYLERCGVLPEHLDPLAGRRKA